MDSNEIWMKISRLIFSLSADRDTQTKEYNLLIDFCTPPVSGLVFDRNSFFKMISTPATVEWKIPSMKTLIFSIVKVETFSEDKSKKRIIYCEFGFIADLNSTVFLDLLKQRTKKKHSHTIFTDDDNNLFNYYFYYTPILPFRIEVWGKQRIIASHSFPSIDAFISIGDNLSYTFELLSSKQKLKCQVRVQWNLS